MITSLRRCANCKNSFVIIESAYCPWCQCHVNKSIEIKNE